jgi:hypothetical protein
VPDPLASPALASGLVSASAECGRYGFKVVCHFDHLLPFYQEVAERVSQATTDCYRLAGESKSGLALVGPHWEVLFNEMFNSMELPEKSC